MLFLSCDNVENFTDFREADSTQLQTQGIVYRQSFPNSYWALMFIFFGLTIFWNR